MAHRGASRAERENTVAAFRRAGEMGAHAVEFDVRRTGDGRLVVHHDAALADGRVIVELTVADLPEHVPTVEEALDTCADMWVNLEIKNFEREPDFDEAESVADDTMALLLDRGEPERWLISSFRMETVDRCRTIADRAVAGRGGVPIRTAWLTSAVPEGTAERLVSKGHAALHPAVWALDRATVDGCHDAGIVVNTWTCDDPERMRELIEWGIDGICTNVPDVALGVISESSRAADPDR